MLRLGGINTNLFFVWLKKLYDQFLTKKIHFDLLPLTKLIQIQYAFKQQKQAYDALKLLMISALCAVHSSCTTNQSHIFHSKDDSCSAPSDPAVPTPSAYNPSQSIAIDKAYPGVFPTDTGITVSANPIHGIQRGYQINPLASLLAGQ